MKISRKEEIEKRWRAFSLPEQMGNIGSEVGRAAKWQNRNKKAFWGAVTRAIELFELTIADRRWGGEKIEIGRAKEVFCDAVLGGKEYNSNLGDLEKYFMQFALLANRNK